MAFLAGLPPLPAAPSLLIWSHPRSAGGFELLWLGYDLSEPIESRAGWLLIATLMTYVSYGGIVTFVTLYAEQFGIAHAGWFFTAYAFGLVLSRAVSGCVFDQQGPKPTIAAGLSPLLPSYVILRLWHTESTHLTSAVLLGLGSGT